MRVYRLIEIQICEGAMSPDGCLHALETVLGVFSSTQNAESMIRANIEKFKDSDYHCVLGYVLYENELDDLTFHGPWKQVPSFLSVRTYLADGTLNACCDCDDVSERAWHGRDPETIRYKPGDFVSVWTGDIVPALISDTPRVKGTIEGDWTDDCYLAHSAVQGHFHPFTPYVFPLVGELAANVKVKIEAARSEWER